jgi:hypothetical protein
MLIPCLLYNTLPVSSLCEDGYWAIGRTLSFLCVRISTCIIKRQWHCNHVQIASTPISIGY